MAPAADRLKDLVDGELARLASAQKITGAVMAAFGPDGTYVSGVGRSGAPGTPAPTGNTIFQLGSITKTFTALSLAIRHHQGRLAISEPAGRYLPEALTPQSSTHPITLAELVSHTSGLPIMPPCGETDPRADSANPYQTFTSDDLAEALRRTPPATPGSYQYSTFGMCLLGHALGAQGEAQVDALAAPITGRLGMADTAVRLTRAQQARKAIGHRDGAPTPDWWMSALSATGALYSTANDMVRYLRAHLGHAPPDLLPALNLTRQPIVRRSDTFSVGFAWHMISTPTTGHTVVWHNGVTGGFSSFIGYVKETGVGVVVLGNDSFSNGRLDGAGQRVIAALDKNAGRTIRKPRLS